MGCGASTGKQALDPNEDPSPQKGKGLSLTRYLGGGKSADGGAAGGRKPPPSKIVRFMLSWPFKRCEPLVELLRLCCFPLLRAHCMRNGWRMIIIDPSTEIDPTQDPRADTHAVCHTELERCIRTSGGPALVALLDHTRDIVAPLPPPLIPEAEFETLLEYVKGDAGRALLSSKHVQWRGLAPDAPRLLLRWYSQKKQTLTGEVRGDFSLTIPAELREGSMFATNGTRLGKSGQHARRAIELCVLGSMLTAVASHALCGNNQGILGRIMQRIARRASVAPSVAPSAASAEGGRRKSVGFVSDEEGGATSARSRRASGEGSPQKSLAEMDVLGAFWDSPTRPGGEPAPASPEADPGKGAASEGEGDVSAPRRRLLSGGLEAEDEEEGDPIAIFDTKGGNRGRKAIQQAAARPEDKIQSIAYSKHYPVGVLHKYEASFAEIALGAAASLSAGHARQDLVSVMHSSAGVAGAPPDMKEEAQVDAALRDVDLVKWKQVRKALAKGEKPKIKFADTESPSKEELEKLRDPRKRPDKLPRNVRKQLKAMGGQEGATSEESGGEDGVSAASPSSKGAASPEKRTPSPQRGRAGSIMNDPKLTSLLRRKGDHDRDDEQERALEVARENGAFVGLSLQVVRMEIEGMSGFSGLHTEISVSMDEDNPYALHVQGTTVRRKPGGDGRFVWNKLTAAPLGQAVVDAGTLTVRVLESRLVGGDRLVGTCTVKLAGASVHEDSGTDGSAWHKILAPPQDPSARGGGTASYKLMPGEAKIVGQCMLNLVVRSPKSGKDLMREARVHINKREFADAIDLLQMSIVQFLDKRNNAMAAVAKDLIQQTETRKQLSEPSTLRRLAWLREQVWGSEDAARAAVKPPVQSGGSVRNLLSRSPSKKDVVATPQHPIYDYNAPPNTSSLVRGMSVKRNDPRNTLVRGGSSRSMLIPEDTYTPKGGEVLVDGFSKTVTSVDLPGYDEEVFVKALATLDEAAKGQNRAVSVGFNHPRKLTATEKIMHNIENMPAEARGALKGVTRSLMGAIQRSINAMNTATVRDPLVVEMEAQLNARRDHVVRFCGRESIVQSLTQYMFEKPSSGLHVQLVEGATGGVGVSAVMSAVWEATEIYMRERAVPGKIMFRSAGVTEGSSELEPLVHSLALQLECERHLDLMDNVAEDCAWDRFFDQTPAWFTARRRQTLVPFEYPDVCRNLRVALKKASAKHPVIIMIDAAEQIYSHDSKETTRPHSTERIDHDDNLPTLARLIQWLPITYKDNQPVLPPYVRVMIAYNGNNAAVKALMKPLTLKENRNVTLINGIQLDNEMVPRILDKLNMYHGDATGGPLNASQLYNVRPQKDENSNKGVNSGEMTARESLMAGRVTPLLLWTSYKVMLRSLQVKGDGLASVGKGDRDGQKAVRLGWITVNEHGGPREACEGYLLQVVERHDRDHALKCIALLACSRAGLTEDELLDMLSGSARIHHPGHKQDELLGDHGAESPRNVDSIGQTLSTDWCLLPADMPPLDALRLLADLRLVLVDKLADGGLVMCFAHVDFKQAALNVSCPTKEAKRKAHMVLGAYFAGRDEASTWLGTTGGETAGAQRVMQQLLDAPLFMPQPWFWDAPSVNGVSLSERLSDRKRVLNLRKMRELVPSLIGACLFDAASSVLTELSYCKIKAEAGVQHALMDEFAEIQRARIEFDTPSRFLGQDGEFQKFMADNRGIIARTPAMLFQLAANSKDGAAAKSAIRHWEKDLGRPPWMKWTNPDTDLSIAGKWSLRVHSKAVTAVATSGDGLVMATASNDRTASLFEASTGRLLCSLPKLSQRVSVMALSPTLSHVASGDADGLVRIWQLGALGSMMADTGQKKGKRMKPMMLPDTPEFGVNGHTGAVRGISFMQSADFVVSVGDDSAVKVWMLSTGSVLRVLNGHKGPVNCVRVLKEVVRKKDEGDGGGIRAEKIFTCGDDGTVREWVVTQSTESRQFEGHTMPVTCLDVCAEAGLVVSCGDDFTCRVWRLLDARSVAVIQHDAALRFVALDHPAETMVSVCAQGNMRLWDIRTYTRIGSTDVSTSPASGGAGVGVIVCTHESVEGLLVFGGADGTLKAWQVRAPSFKAHPGLHESGRGVVTLCVHDSTIVSTGGTDVAVWDTRTSMCRQKIVTHQAQVTSVDLDRASKWLLATSSSSGEVLFWDVRGEAASQAPVYSLAAHMRPITHVAFSPDGTAMLTTSHDSSVKIFRLAGTASHKTLDNPPTDRNSAASASLTKKARKEEGLSVKILHNLIGHEDATLFAVFSPDSSVVASSALDGTVRLWSMVNGGPLQTFAVMGKPTVFLGIAWSKDMRSVATGSADGVVRLWDVKTGREAISMRAKRNLQLIKGLSLGSIINGAGWQFSEVDGHRSPVTTVAFNKPGTLVVSGSQDGTVKVWLTRSGKLVRTVMRCQCWVNRISVSIDGGKVYAACSDGEIRSSRMPTADKMTGALTVVSTAAPLSARSNDPGDGAATNRSMYSTAGTGSKLPPLKGKGGKGNLTNRSEVSVEVETFEAEDEDTGPQEEIKASVDDGRTFDHGLPLYRLKVCGHSSYCATVNLGSQTIELRDTGSLHKKATLTGHKGEVTDISTGAEAAWLVSSGLDGLVKVWDTGTGNCRHTQPCFRQGATAVELFQPSEIAAVGSALGDIQLVDMSAGGSSVQKFEGPEDIIISLGFADEGRTLMSAHVGGIIGMRDLRAAGKVFNIDTNSAMSVNIFSKGLKVVRRGFNRLIGGPKEKEIPKTMCASILPDGRLVLRTFGPFVEVWDMRMRKKVFTETSHTGIVHSARFLNNGEWVVSAGSDCTVRLWSVPQGREPSSGNEDEWSDLRSTAFQAGYYGQLQVVPSRGLGTLTYTTRQEVRAVGGWNVDTMFAGDCAGKIYKLSLMPGKDPF